MTFTLRLESCKYAYRAEHLLPEEQRLWMDHMREDGYEMTDPQEIFTPFAGEVLAFDNEESSIEELQVRVWVWTDTTGVEHRLLDINGWPGDNESGFIAMNGLAILSNSDQCLEWKGEPDTAFAPHLKVFDQIRCNLEENPYYEFDDELDQQQFEQFFASEAGKEAIQMANTAFDKLLREKEDLRQFFVQTRDRYLEEFTPLATLPKPLPKSFGIPTPKTKQIVAQKIAESIGYNLEPNYHYDLTHFYFVRWNSPFGPMILVTVRRTFLDQTFLFHADDSTQIFEDEYVLSDEFSPTIGFQAAPHSGKIGQQVFEGHYLYQKPTDDVTITLAPRIHAYMEVLRKIRW